MVRAQAMGLAQVRHWARLLPQLLAWAGAGDAATRARALRALHASLRAAWPRAPAHARLIWHHLAVADDGLAAAPAVSRAEGLAAQGGPESDLEAQHRAGGGLKGNKSKTASAEAEAAQWARAVAEVLWRAGGEGFRSGVRDGAGPEGCRLRAHVLGLDAVGHPALA